jgi:uncharacterized protein (TIGR01732 family)
MNPILNGRAPISYLSVLYIISKFSIQTKGSVKMYNNVNVAPIMSANVPFPHENVAPIMGANVPFPHENVAPIMEANMPFQPENVAPIMEANVPFQPELSYGYAAPAYGYCNPSRGCESFVIIVVLFILLIIVGACTFHFQDCKG